MNKQPEALRLADELQVIFQADFYVVCDQASTELRRQHALIAELVASLQDCVEDSEEVRQRMVESYGTNYKVARQDAMREQIAKARAAIAKAEDQQ